ncbi:hypothetical protein [Sphingomonas melonis]|uniref:hypothetical protein n=1 Tax=Sphingomonas melonis TaxID=152682 RepID=UPI0004775D82|nr:hypothetical protein [Sphingomonas melonis]
MGVRDQLQQCNAVVNISFIDAIQMLEVPDHLGTLFPPRDDDAIMILSSYPPLDPVEVDHVHSPLELVCLI